MAKFGIGQAVRRVEDQRFLLGQGRYVDDISLPGQCYGVAVLSPHAHARITRIDVAKAQAAPGVVCVLTGADAAADQLGSFTSHLMPEDLGAPKGHRTFQPVLNAEKVRFVGDRIAFVVAETPVQARDAAELVEVHYASLAAVVALEDAAKENAVKVWEDCPQGNVGFRLMFGDKAATDATFAAARHVVKLRVENNRVSPASMEPRVAIGDYDAAEDHYTLYTTSQNPHGVREEMAHIFHVAENQIRVVSPDVGGGFGLKGGPFPDDALVLWASRRIRRPVKWTEDRNEHLLAVLHVEASSAVRGRYHRSPQSQCLHYLEANTRTTAQRGNHHTRLFDIGSQVRHKPRYPNARISFKVAHPFGRVCSDNTKSRARILGNDLWQDLIVKETHSVLIGEIAHLAKKQDGAFQRRIHRGVLQFLPVHHVRQHRDSRRLGSGMLKVFDVCGRIHN